MASFIRFLLRHRRLATVAILLSLAASLYSAREIELRFQYRDFYDYSENPNLAMFKRDSDLFGDPAGYLIAMVQTDDVFRAPVLEYIARLTSELEPRPEFSRVRSLTNVNAVRGRGDEVLSGKLMPRLPATSQQANEIKQYVLHSPLFVHRLISDDATTTAVLADMRVPAAFATIAQQRAAKQALEDVLARNPAPPGVHISLSGSPVIEIESTRALLRDQAVLLPVVSLVLGLMLLLTFRSLQGVLLCLASVGVAFAWTAGLFALSGRPVDIIASIIPTTLLVYGVVDPIFVLARFLTKIDAGRRKEDAIVETLSELALPCFLTSVTTSVGFAAFVTCFAPTIRYYGLTVGIGVLLAFVTTVTILPLLLSVTPMPKRASQSGALARRVDQFLQRFALRIEGNARFVSGLALVLVALAAYFGSEQHIDNAYVDSLPDGRIHDDVRLLEQKLAGVGRAIVVLEGKPDSMQRPEVLRAMQGVQKAMERFPEVTFSASLADLVTEADQAFRGGEAGDGQVPKSPALVAQYMALVEPRDRADFVTNDYSKAHVLTLLKDHGSEATAVVIDAFRRAIDAADFPSLGIKASVTGHAVVAYRELDRIVRELLGGFATAFLIVLAFEWVTFRSLRLTLLTIVPNLIPIGVCFLVTRYLHIALRIDTILVLCISIGGLFNTTIHIVARVLQQVQDGRRDPEQIIVDAMRAVGPPSLFTTIVLSAGFAVFWLSSFPGLKMLGLLTTVTLLSGFVSDMVFTPAMIRAGYDWKRAFARDDARTQQTKAMITSNEVECAVASDTAL